MKRFLLFTCAVLGVVMFANGTGGIVFATEQAAPGTDDSEIYIKAINPGYTVNGVSNVGEMIEIARRKNSDKMISLTGFSIGYTNSSGNGAVLFEFPENSWMAGETILLRLASSPGHELANLLYTKTLAAKAGPLELKHGEEVVSSVCWTNKDDCYKDFKSSSPTTLVFDEELRVYEHVENYEPQYLAENYYEEEKPDEVVPSQCKGLMFSEIFTYYESEKSEQFVEFYNSSSEQILMKGCKLKYKNKYYELDGVVKADGYVAKYFDAVSFTKNPSSANLFELVDANGETLDAVQNPNGQRRGASYAWIGFDGNGKKIWKGTYALTPGQPNNYQEYKTCEAGKVINPETGNCVKPTEVKIKICKDGYFLNILTGRCNKIQTAVEKTCKEGYYLNEETGRCRKIQENSGADYGIVPEEYEESSSFVALYAVLGVVGVGIVYIIYEFRRDIAKIWNKAFRRFR